MVLKLYKFINNLLEISELHEQINILKNSTLNDHDGNFDTDSGENLLIERTNNKKLVAKLHSLQQELNTVYLINFYLILIIETWNMER